MNILEWVLDKGTKYAPLLKTGVAALSTYASFKDQQKKNQMQQDAYDDYMAQADAAGHAARAAIDVNYTPMTVSGVPTTKADVTDFTAVAARGGLMTLPNKQRKRYYAGTGEEDIEVMDIDVTEPTTSDLEKETGLNLSGEQVKYNTGNPREGAWSVWNSGGIDQEIYEFDFEIFFDSGDWMDMLKGQVDVEGDTKMASGPSMEDSRNELALQLFGKELRLLTEEEMNMLNDEADRLTSKFTGATGGIAGLRHGGRPGYNIGEIVTADTEGVVSEVSPSRKTQIEGNQLAEDAYNEIFQKFYETFPGIEEEVNIEDMIAMLQAEGVIGTEDLGILGLDRSMDMITPQSVRSDIPGVTRAMAQGGRIKKDNGGIMNLGGLEKDYRTTGGFVPIGGRERADDVPARLSKNEFVMTADAVRAAGGGSINKGAQRMYDTMKHLEANPQSRRMTA
jgi:hypothetical protein